MEDKPKTPGIKTAVRGHLNESKNTVFSHSPSQTQDELFRPNIP